MIGSLGQVNQADFSKTVICKSLYDLWPGRTSKNLGGWLEDQKAAMIEQPMAAKMDFSRAYH